MSDWSIDLSGIGTGIPLLSFSMGDPRGGSVQVTKNVDSHSPAIFRATTTAEHIAEAAVHSRPMTYRFTDCILASYAVSQDWESWSLSFATVELDSAEGTSVEYDRMQQATHMEPHVEAPPDAAFAPAPADEGVTEV